MDIRNVHIGWAVHPEGECRSEGGVLMTELNQLLRST